MIDRLIENAMQLDRAIRFMSRQAYPFRLTITDGRPKSYDQTKLMWKWATEAASQRPGMTVTEVQNEWKLLFGVPIMCAGNDDFAKSWAIISKGYTHEEQLELIMPWLSVTSAMTVGQQKQFLDEVEQYNIRNGIELTDTEERRYGPQGRRVDRDGTKPSGCGDTAAGTTTHREGAAEEVRGLYTGLQREAKTGDASRTTPGGRRRE